MLLTNAERYYRIMYYGSRASWNLRDEHKANRIAILPEFLAAELTDIVLTAGRHFRGFSIADVGIVRPNDAFAVLTMIGKQCLESVEHNAAVRSGAVIAAIGSTLLRSPGIISPTQ
jgi:hypothetical protein